MAGVGRSAPQARPGGEPATGQGALWEGLLRQLEAEHARWFLWVPVLFGIGIATYFELPAEPSLLAALLPAVTAAVLYFAAGRSGALTILATTGLLAAALGLAVAKIRTEVVRAPVLQHQLGPVEVKGYVELVEPRATKGQRLTLQVSLIEKLETRDWPYRVRIRTALENPQITPGDAVRLKATLSPPPGPSLPGDYDFARAAWFQALGGVGFARGRAELDPDGAEERPLWFRAIAAVARVRQEIGRRIVAALPGQTGAIANALITGERGGITEATNQAFRDAGLFHILSISGLHMVIMAGAVFFSVRFALAAIPALALRYPIKKWAAGAAMAGAFAYLLISGSSFPTVRSYVMISIMFLAVLLDRPAMALRNVALAAFVILIAWPESLFDPGFQMSFAAVVALVSVYERLKGAAGEATGPRQRGAFRQAISFLGGIVTSTLVASLAVAPFGIYHFHNTQHFAMLANLIAIPICNLIVMPAALAALVALPFGLEAAPLRLMGWGIEAMVWCAVNVAALPGAVGRLPSIPTYAFVLMVAGGLWCALWAGRWRLLGVVPLALGLGLAPTERRPDVLVGRGTALVAVRDPQGRLSALAGPGTNFELARWLEHDGDTRAPAEVAKAHAFRCDGIGCTAYVSGKLLAVATTPAALRDDCASAAILVIKFAKPRGCTRPLLTIDVDDVAARGPHALYLDTKGIRVETVNGLRGNRPWARSESASSH